MGLRRGLSPQERLTSPRVERAAARGHSPGRPFPCNAALTLSTSRPSLPEMRAVARPLRGLARLPLTALLAATACTEPNPYLNVCGNGLHEPQNGEECDNGPDNADDAACTSTCQLAPGPPPRGCGEGPVPGRRTKFWL